MKTLQIVIHCLPREIDQLERICNSLRESYFFVENQLNIVLDVTLNLNEVFTDWEKSSIPKEFFINKFETINKFNDWTYKNIFEIDEQERCLGINDKRRNSINDDINTDYLMYLDLDLYFPNIALNLLSQLLTQIDTEYCIISPELTKLWDESWDGLVNRKYSTEAYGYYKEMDPFKVNSIAYNNILEENIGVRTLTPIKFGGGWFNVFSKNLLKYINIPSSLGPYGLDDTFIMVAAEAMRQRGYNIQQYILEGVVCVENVKYSIYEHNPYRDLIVDKSLQNKGREFKQNYRDNAQNNFNLELTRFLDKITNKI